MDIEHAIQCGAPHTIAKLVQITSITFGFMILTPIVNGGYKPTYNWGAPHCMVFTAFFIAIKHLYRFLHLQKPRDPLIQQCLLNYAYETI